MSTIKRYLINRFRLVNSLYMNTEQHENIEINLYVTNILLNNPSVEPIREQAKENNDPQLMQILYE